MIDRNLLEKLETATEELEELGLGDGTIRRKYRRSGVLLPIFSLPSPYGIGTLGKAAKEFVDFLRRSGQSYWQILPIGHIDYVNSPYQSFSAKAGNPYFIDLEELCHLGILETSALNQLPFGDNPSQVDYELMRQNRLEILRWAYDTFNFGAFAELRSEFKEFCAAEESWLGDYSLYMAIKAHENGAPWQAWPTPLKERDPEALLSFAREHQDQIGFYQFLQFLFYRQWQDLRSYANEAGIKLIGDIPIYLAADCVDVWSNPELFQLDCELNPTFVAGCPPDYFSEDGQLWGNPLYDWQKMAEDNYSWWVKRLQFALRFYDLVRIDHFRGLESYWAVPYGDVTAKRGLWVKGPGIALFEALEEALGELPLIAEDLGIITAEVHTLRRICGLPGMKVLEFAFSPNAHSDYLPHHVVENCVLYVGTHDNDTARGWLKNGPKADVKLAKEYFNLQHIPEDDEYSAAFGFIKGAMATVANTVILQMQDLLALGSESRINTPGTVSGNWQWRMLPGVTDDNLAEKLRSLAHLTDRLPS